MAIKVVVNGINCTSFVPLPFSEQITLDRSLDFASIKLNFTPFPNPFKPFADVVITIGDYEGYYYVANDKCEEIIQTHKYNHTLLLIEQTKILERFVGRNRTITQPLNSQYNRKTVTSEVIALLNTIETLWTDETSRFTFNQEQVNKYIDTELPEITLTGTLYEQLSQIGNCIHSVPRLKNNVLYFDEIGSAEKLDEEVKASLSDYISNISTFDIEQYAVAIDSNIDNFVGNFIEEPSSDTYRSVRTDVASVQIKDENLFIETKYPIEKLLSLKVAFDDAYLDYMSFDITPHVYTDAEYITLSSIVKVYPNSKAYALQYTVGANNIKGLNFKPPNAVDPSKENYSIINILEKVSGKTLSGTDLQSLLFRVTYVPIINGRARQYKQNIKDYDKLSVLTYNQSSQKISSEAMGQTMKNFVERLGNPEISKVYLLPEDNVDFDGKLQVGKKFDNDYYISVIKREYYPEFNKVELGLSKNFNKLNEYVGLNNQVRFYEISENQIVNSQIMYEEFCVIGDLIEDGDGKVAVNVEAIANWLTNKIEDKINVVHITGYSVYGDKLATVELPIASYPMGNSILLSFSYDDNYSAGNQLERLASGTIIQKQVKYTDGNGEMRWVDIKYGVLKNERTADFTPNAVADYEYADAIPSANNTISNYCFNEKMNLKIQIYKENRSIPTINYMLHFVTNRDDIIIGDAMSKQTYLTYKDDGLVEKPVQIYVYDKELSMYDNILEGGTYIKDLESYTYDNVENGRKAVDFGSFTSSVNGKSYAVVQDIGNKKYFLFGQNIEISENDQIDLPKLNFVHKIL